MDSKARRIGLGQREPSFRDGMAPGPRAWGGLLLAGFMLSACQGEELPPPAAGPAADWAHWGGDEGGMRYSPLDEITPQNVKRLKKAWTYHIGMLDAPDPSSPTFEGTPLVADGRMFVCSGLGKIAAVDPANGRELWAYRYQADTRQLPAELPWRDLPSRPAGLPRRVPRARVRRHARRPPARDRRGER